MTQRKAPLLTADHDALADATTARHTATRHMAVRQTAASHAATRPMAAQGTTRAPATMQRKHGP
jgi:hypothetical protein